MLLGDGKWTPGCPPVWTGRESRWGVAAWDALVKAHEDAGCSVPGKDLLSPARGQQLLGGFRPSGGGHTCQPGAGSQRVKPLFSSPELRKLEAGRDPGRPGSWPRCGKEPNLLGLICV